MEANSPLVTLTIDQATKANLSETAKWARVLAVVGFIFLGFAVLSGYLVSITLSRIGEVGENSRFGTVAGFAGMGLSLLYIFFALLAILPLVYIFRFASQMRSALSADDQKGLNASFQNLKACLRYLGIITIVSLVLMALSLIFVVTVGGLASR